MTTARFTTLLATTIVVAAACGVGGQPCKDVLALNDDDCAGGASLARSIEEDPRYGEGGACWVDDASARACTAHCEDLMDICAQPPPP